MRYNGQIVGRTGRSCLQEMDCTVYKGEVVQIGVAGAFGVRTFNTTTEEHHILPVSISMQGASCIVSLGSLHMEPPPYRIVNR